MKLKINRDFARWMDQHFYPDVKKMAELQMELHETDSEEYWARRIVKSVLNRMQHEAYVKLVTTKSPCINISLEDEQVFCLYKTMQHYPIAGEYHVWADMMLKKTVAALDQVIKNPHGKHGTFNID